MSISLSSDELNIYIARIRISCDFDNAASIASHFSTIYEVLLNFYLSKKCRMEWLLDDFYDTRHRAYMMTEKGKVVTFFNCHRFVPLDMA